MLRKVIEMIPLICDGIYINVISVLNTELDITVKSLNVQMEEVIKCLQNEEYVLVSDSLKY